MFCGIWNIKIEFQVLTETLLLKIIINFIESFYILCLLVDKQL